MAKGACMAKGGMHGKGGACVVKGVFVAGGMHGRGDVHGRGACMVGGVHGGLCGRWACVAEGAWYARPPPNTMRYGRSMRGRYASYWNAFLLII